MDAPNIITPNRTLVEPKVIHRHNQKDYRPRAWDLRWHIEYLNRPFRSGRWSAPGETDSCKASKQPLDSIARCVIQGKNRLTRHQKDFVWVGGQDYIEFRWIACISAPANSKSQELIKGFLAKKHGRPIDLRHRGSIQGMTLVTRNEKIHVFIDGTVHREPNNEPKVHSAAWSR